MTTLVTGGAGYIGAHVARLLARRGPVLVVDDLSTGVAERVAGLPLLRLDLTQAAAVPVLVEAMRAREVTGVVHLAGRKQVGESVARPVWYFEQNMGSLGNVLTAMEQAGVHRLVFSSSAAVYGEVPAGPVSEEAPCRPLSPYGESKLVGEWLCRDAERAWGLSWSALRYFNVAGAGAPDLGDPEVLNLVSIAIDSLRRGLRPRIFGRDYDTPDGTCVRDYVHVADLAQAHLAVLDHLAAGAAAGERIFNVGTGRGASVLEVLAALGRVAGTPVVGDEAPRRAGDAAAVTADVTRIEEIVGWQAQQGLEEIVSSAWQARLAAEDVALRRSGAA